MLGNKTKLIAALMLCQFLAGARWYKENLAYGMRDTILFYLAHSPSDPDTLYLSSIDGYVFSSHNRGISWNEARIIVKQQAFFGAIRPAASPSGVPISAAAVMSDPLMQDDTSYDMRRNLSFPVGATGASFLDAGNQPNEFDAVAGIGNVPKPEVFGLTDTAGSLGGCAAAKLGIALKTGAPRLKGMLRAWGYASVGMNLQQLLVEKGVEPTWVNHIGVHPTDPNTAIAATSMGTYRTTDGGIGWLPVFAGTNKGERDGQHAHYHPVDGNKVYLGTQNGLFISDTGGDRWSRVSGTQLEGAVVKWIEPIVTAEGEVWVYAASTIGGFLSRDGGDSWKWIFFETLPETNFVTSIAVDRQNPEHVLFGTADGPFVTYDAGRNWERSGGLLFTATYIPRILMDPDDGSHAITCTELNVWETFDGGRTWSIIYIDNGDWKIRNITYDPHDKSLLWVITSGEVLRLSTRAPVTSKSEREQLFREAFDREPGEHQVLDAVFRTFYIHPGVQGRMRETYALYDELLPQVSFVAGYFSYHADSDLSVPIYDQVLDGTSVMEKNADFGGPYAAVLLTWNFANVVFDFDAINYGRIFGAAVGSMYNMKFQVARYYNERLRLMRKLMVDPPDDLSAHVDASLRYQELTEHLNALTGGLYDPVVEQIHQGGIPWLVNLQH